MPQYQFRLVRIPAWQVILIAALALALVAAFFVAAVGIFLVLVPLFVLIGAIAYLYAMFRGARARRAADRRTIEAEYRVIEQERIERKPRSRK
jgi:hypothetical protein